MRVTMTTELNVQKFLRGGGTVADLERTLFIKSYGATDAGRESLVGLKYSQIDSPRFDPIVRECRGIVLDAADNWRVVAKPFTRFYNLDECAADMERLTWPVSTVEKEDGSLIILYHYRGKWRVNTSGSFATGEVYPGGPTWTELFWKTAPFNEEKLKGLEHCTLLFELCTLENKVVRRYKTPSLFLIGAMQRCYGPDFDKWIDTYESGLDDLAQDIGCQRAKQTTANSIAAVVGYVRHRVTEENDFEGVVLRDNNDIRIKVKSPEYLALAHMKDNGNLFREKNLVPWALREDPTELLLHFPECEERLRSVSFKVAEERARLEAAWHAYRGIPDQKAFALSIKDKTKFTGILFQQRKVHGVTLGPLAEVREKFSAEPERVAKVLFDV